MKGHAHEGRAAAAPSPWAALEDCGDSFELVLQSLAPADVAVSRGHPACGLHTRQRVLLPLVP